MLEWLVSALVFLAVLLAGLELGSVWQRRRLRRQALMFTGATVGGRQAAFRLIQETLATLGNRLVQWVPETWFRQTTKRLAAIFPGQGWTPLAWLGLKVFSLAAGIGFGWVLGVDGFLVLVLALGAGFLPDLWLKEKHQARQRQIMRELPDRLDLMASCLEAGLGFQPALAVLLERGSKGPLMAELGELARSLSMGQSRQDALGCLAGRVDHPDFSAFIQVWVQSERLGVSVASVLKQQAGLLRHKRSQHAEKLALEAPVKLLFPLILFIFPVVFMILFGPIVIRFLQGF